MYNNTDYYNYLNYMNNYNRCYDYENIYKDNNLLDPKQALTDGNLFKNKYVGYKNYSPSNINSYSSKDKLLNEILSYNFTLKELNLYLDNNPNDINYINMYNKYNDIKNKLVMQYEKIYGPLELDSNYLNNRTWTWNNSPWPWEGYI